MTSHKLLITKRGVPKISAVNIVLFNATSRVIFEE